MKVTLAIYLRGDLLDPDFVTSTIGFEPTRSFKKNDVLTTNSGNVSRQRTGCWVWSSSKFEEQFSLGELIVKLSQQFKEAPNLRQIVGVDEAWIDFLVLQPKDGQDDEMVFELTPEEALSLSRFGLPITFTCGFVKE